MCEIVATGRCRGSEAQDTGEKNPEDTKVPRGSGRYREPNKAGLGRRLCRKTRMKQRGRETGIRWRVVAWE